MVANCFICNQVPESPADAIVFSGDPTRAKNLFIVFQRALDLPALAADQFEISRQISYCKSCLDELKVTESVLDAFDKLKKIADSHKREIKSKFLEGRVQEGKAKSKVNDQHRHDVTEFRSKVVAVLKSRSRSASVTDSTETSGVFKRVTRTRTKPNHYRRHATGFASQKTSTSDSPPHLQMSSNSMDSTGSSSADQLEMSGENDVMNNLNDSGNEAVTSHDLLIKAGQSDAMETKRKVLSKPDKRSPKSLSIPTKARQAKPNEKKHKCQQCPARFRRKDHLTSHLRIHTGEKPFSCTVCPKTFAQLAGLRQHHLIHSGGKLHTCKYCSKKFGRHASLTVHERVHTGEKPHLCKICLEKFVTSSCLVRHTRVHTKEEPYPCRICLKTFSQSNNLVRHMRSHTGERPFRCTTCSKKFTQLISLRRHRKTHKPME